MEKRSPEVSGKNNQIHNMNPEMQQLNYNINLSHAIMGEHITPLYKFGIK
jgi:hypothetical protein